MQKRWKHTIIILSLFILLPYIVTVFMKGEGSFPELEHEKKHVTVQVNGIKTQVLWDEFLLGVVAKEIPLTYSYEAMKAQTVMARTRLVKEATGKKAYVYKETYFTAEEIQQKWQYLEPIEVYHLLKSAVQETKGQVLMYDDNYIETPYHLLSNGTTRSGVEVLGAEEYEYLTAVKCQLDTLSNVYSSVKKISYKELIKELGLTVKTSDIKWDNHDVKINETDKSNYVKSINIKGNIVTGEVFRKKFNLPSSAIQLELEDEYLIVTTEGIGHGIGLSQNTAHYMGLEGKKYEDILMYFFKHTKIISEK